MNHTQFLSGHVEFASLVGGKCVYPALPRGKDSSDFLLCRMVVFSFDHCNNGLCSRYAFMSGFS